MSLAKVSQLSGRTGGNVIIPTGNKLVTTNDATTGIYGGPGAVIQQKRVSTYPTSHLSTAGGPVLCPLEITFTPKLSNSIILVEFFSTMLYGAAGWLVSTLYRKGGTYATNNWWDANASGGNNFNNLTPDTRATYRYAYGWNYTSNNWSAAKFRYFDKPGCNTEIAYRLYYQSSGTNYLVHQYMEYGWVLTEIRGKD